MAEDIQFLDLKKISDSFEPEMSEAILRVVKSGWYLQGQSVKNFEQEFADYCGSRFCIGVGNGLDALTLILTAYKHLLGWNDGDEVIVSANTYIASILAITKAGLKPVACEPSLDDYLIDVGLIEQLVNNRTRAIMPVHLYGRCCDMTSIAEIAHKHNRCVGLQFLSRQKPWCAGRWRRGNNQRRTSCHRRTPDCELWVGAKICKQIQRHKQPSRRDSSGGFVGQAQATRR